MRKKSILLLAFLLTSCGGAEEPTTSTTTSTSRTTSTTTSTTAEATSGAEATAGAAAAASTATIVPGSRAPLAGKTPALKITGDAFQMGKEVTLKLEVRNWDIGPAPGKHVHLIIDNEPYIAIRDVSKPLNLNELARTKLGKELSDGTHVVRMFPSRATHESVKKGTPLLVRLVHYGTPSSNFRFNANAPLLTYSRPKGCYAVGDRILLDFYVSNVKLGRTLNKVRVSIDGAHVADLKKWAPHYIEGLGKGDHTIRLQLIDAKKEPVPGPYNDTTRTITVAKSCK